MTVVAVLVGLVVGFGAAIALGVWTNRRVERTAFRREIADAEAELRQHLELVELEQPQRVLPTPIDPRVFENGPSRSVN